MNVKQKTLAALLVLGIGVSGCNTNDNDLIPQIVNKKTDENKTEGNRTIIPVSYTHLTLPTKIGV